jgi:hypothetical protein
MEDVGKDIGGSRAKLCKRVCSKGERGKDISCFRCPGRGFATVIESVDLGRRTNEAHGKNTRQELFSPGVF